MKETYFAAVKRRYRNLRNFQQDIYDWTDEHGNRYLGKAAVDEYLDRPENNA
jgi:hypothetical protein